MKKTLIVVLLLTILSSCSFRIGKKDNPLFEIKGDALDTYLEEMSEEAESGKEDLVKEYEEAKETVYAEQEEQAKEEAKSGKTVLNITSPKSPKILRTADTRVVIWGDIYNAEKVAKVTVNDYQLFKYKRGNKKFNYIASRRGGTLKRGENTYTVKAYDSEENLLSETEYKVISDAKYKSLTHSGPTETLLLVTLVSFFFAFTRRRA